MVPGKLDSYMQKNEIGLLFTPYTKINSKWIEHLNVRLEIIKLLKENIGSHLLASATRLGICLRKPGKQAKINYWDYTKMKSFCTAKETTNQQNKKATY